MSQSGTIRCRGVYTHPSSFSEVPDGALERGDNCILNRQGILESRRGLKDYGSAISGSTVRRVIPFDSGLLAHAGTELLQDDGAGSWTAITGSISEPPGYRVRDAVAKQSLYLTSSLGVKKVQDLSSFATPFLEDAGLPRSLDGTYSLTGTSGFLSDNAGVAYRLLLYAEDVHGRLVRAAPSQRLVALNASGGTRDVSLTWYLPDGLTTSVRWRLYRSPETATVTDVPEDELQLVAEGAIDSTDLSNGYVEMVDTLPESLRAEALYTNPSQEGIANQNDQPPFAIDLALYKDVLFYANTIGKHRLGFTLIGAGEESFGYAARTGDTSSGSAIVQNVSDGGSPDLGTTNLRVGMRASGAGIPGTARILSVDSATQVTLTEDATANGSGTAIEFQDVVSIAGQEYYAASATSLADHEFEATIDDTPATNIDLTARSLTFAINQDPDNSSVYAFYTSNFEDVPGSITVEERSIGGSAFTAYAPSNAGSAFNPALPLADGKSSVADTNPGDVAFSKPGEPGAVPLGNKIATGLKRIDRILALRTGVFVLGEKVVRIGGEDAASFTADDLDQTAKLIAPESAVVFNDRIFALTTQGVVAISDSGVAVVSRPIEGEIQRVSSVLFTDFADLVFGIGYESARLYLLAVQDAEADSNPVKWWAYNAFTNEWTGPWQLPSTAGCVNPATDRLMVVDADTRILREERKTFSQDDYADREFAVVVSSSSGAVVTLADASDVAAGHKLVQGTRSSIVTGVDGNDVTVEDELAWVAGAATSYEPIDCVAEFLQASEGNPAAQKHWPEVQVLLETGTEVGRVTVGFATNFEPDFAEQALDVLDVGGAWGEFPWGEAPWGVPQRGKQVLRTYVPVDYQRAHWLKLRVSWGEALKNCALAGVARVSELMSSRF